MRVVGRLAGGVPPASLASALDDVSRRSSPPARVVAMPVVAAIARDVSRTLALLGGAAALAIAIAFANLAGLLLVRIIDRRRELALRTALGARRFEVVFQVLLEAQALVAIGVGAGVILALWMTPVVGRLALEQFSGLAQRDLAFSWEATAAMAAAASACAYMCALLPGHAALKTSVSEALRRGTAPPKERIPRRVLVGGEVALAFVLIALLAVLGRSLVRVLDVHPGFHADGVMALQVSLPEAAYPGFEPVVSFYSALQAALENRLGGGAVAIVDELPLTGDRGRSLVSLTRTEGGREAVTRTASPGYFGVMRIPVLAGRPFDAIDDAGAPPRVVISETLATRLFGVDAAIGRQIWVMARRQRAEVIGVAGDVRHRALDEPVLPTVYLSGFQTPSPSSVVVVRSSRPEADAVRAVREEVARLDPRVPVYRVRPMTEVVAVSPGVPARRVLTSAFGGFALLALVLAATGLFGVVAHEVASRRVEFAVRAALGANPLEILRAAALQSGWMMGGGLAVGTLLALWATQVVNRAGFAVAGTDGMSLVLAAASLLAAGGAAVLAAARRAARNDPVVALRGE